MAIKRVKKIKGQSEADHKAAIIEAVLADKKADAKYSDVTSHPDWAEGYGAVPPKTWAAAKEELNLPMTSGTKATPVTEAEKQAVLDFALDYFGSEDDSDTLDQNKWDEFVKGFWQHRKAAIKATLTRAKPPTAAEKKAQQKQETIAALVAAGMEVKKAQEKADEIFGS